ncbi:hypothetical protein JCM10213_002199 [Rhodosporidiobolus nylandii]
MATYGRFPAPSAAYSPQPPPVPSFQAPPPPPPPQPGHLPPGTVVNVGEYTVTVERFLSEGGFAHVYLANSAVPLPKGSPTATTKHVLKRMAVPDKRGVEEVGREVDVMRQLKNHPKIVNMIEASVADLPGGVDGSKGYEIYILMEWCPGGGIIDMMNTRLQNRLTESEILKIFSDVVEAVAHMHYQSPPLIHRDLKVENILLTPPNTYKLCDFGSTTRPLPREKVPTAVEGIQRIEMEINKTTTLQYRAPELVDVWGRKGFDEKIDIWALGVFLYKLCFYTTPFEEHGPLAILNAQYKFPPYPAYSSNIRSLIASMLQERASQRPNIYQVHEMVCRLRGAPVRLENKYANLAPVTTGTGLSRAATLSPSSGVPLSVSSSPVPRPTSGIISSTAPSAPPSALSGLGGLAEQIAPMRRGRPGKAPAPVPAAEPGRQVRTGLASVGTQAETHVPPSAADAGAWESFAAAGKSPTLPSHGFDSAPPLSPRLSAGGGEGFGDAFTPSAELSTAIELPANAAMFAELVPPSKTAKESGRASPMDLLRQQKAEQQHAHPQQKQEKEDDDRKRFEAAFPDLENDPDLAAFAPKPSSSPLPPQPPSLIDAPSPPSAMPSQLTGEPAAAAGPPLPRRPPTSASTEPSRLPTPGAPSPASSPVPPQPQQQTPQQPRAGFKPELVSRASQTSPHLLASWRGGSGGGTASTSAAVSANGQGQSGLRQSSVPELDLSSPADSPVLSHGEAAEQKKVVDLLGPDEDDDEAFAPRRSPASVASPSSAHSTLPPLTSPVPSFASSAPAEQQQQEQQSTSSLAGNVASKRMSYSSAPSSLTSAAGQEREKFRPITKRTSWLPPSSASPVSSPLGSPKPQPPSLAKKPSGTGPGETAAEKMVEEEQAQDSVEERFPALSLQDAPPPAATAQNGGGEQWEKVVEKEDDGDDSSDDESPAVPQSAPKAQAPAFDDDDDFAPRPMLPTIGTANARPKFGGGFKPSQPTAPPLATSTTSLTSPSAEPAQNILSPPPDARGLSTASTSSSSTGGGGIDLGPALASIHRFAPSSDSTAPPQRHLLEDGDDFPAPAPSSPKPTSPPPLASPKPQPTQRKAALHSLVSRFEGSGAPLTGGPPPLGVKPVGLRKDSTGSSASAGGMGGFGARDGLGGQNARGYQRDEVRPRALPQWTTSATGARSPLPVDEKPEERDEDDFAPPVPPKPATPSFTGSSASSPVTRAPFKPVPPPGSPSAGGGFGGAGKRTSMYGAPSSSAGGGQPSFVPKSVSPAPSAQSSSEEERFAGVSNMKSRWESMAKSKEEGERKVPGGKRKEWAAV